MRFLFILAIAASVNAATTNFPYFYPVGDSHSLASDPMTNTTYWSSASLPSNASSKQKPTAPPKPKGPPKILSAQQRADLSRIKSKGFIIAQKDLPGGKKELTWTDGKNTIITTQKVERIQGKKSADPRRAEIETVKAERDALKAEKEKASKPK